MTLFFWPIMSISMEQVLWESHFCCGHFRTVHCGQYGLNSTFFLFCYLSEGLPTSILCRDWLINPAMFGFVHALILCQFCIGNWYMNLKSLPVSVMVNDIVNLEFFPARILACHFAVTMHDAFHNYHHEGPLWHFVICFSEIKPLDVPVMIQFCVSGLEKNSPVPRDTWKMH